MFTQAPPRNHEQSSQFECTESNAGSKLDMSLVIQSVLTFVPAVLKRDGNVPAIEFSILEGAVFGFSAAYGFRKSSRCRDAKRQLTERLALARLPLAVAVEPVYSVRITPTFDTLAIGERSVLLATALRASGSVMNGRDFTWSSSDTALATVDGSGLVSARGIGKVTIVARTGTVVGIATLVVTPPR